MTTWMTRGLAFAAAMVVVRLFQGTLINVWQTQAGLISIALLIIFLGGPIAWGVLDGRADATASPDPDRRADLAMTWLLAGLVAGVLSGAVSWLIGIFYNGLYTGGVFNELTTFAAFTALIVFVLGIGGVAVGRWIIDRQREKQPRSHHGLAAEADRADTDVFAAVRAEAGSWTDGSGTQAQEHNAAVATAERDEPTESIPVAPMAGLDEPTEIIRTDPETNAEPDTAVDPATDTNTDVDAKGEAQGTTADRTPD